MNKIFYAITFLAIISIAATPLNEAPNGTLTTDDGWIHLRSQGQKLYGDNSAALRYYSRHGSATNMHFYDRENTLYGKVYGSGNGSTFGLQDGDGHYTYKAVKDNYTAFSINNSEKMRINSNGYLGIGTNTPGTRLHAKGFIRSSFAGDLNSYTEMGHGGGNSFINAEGPGNLEFRHDNSTKMVVTDAGRVGIRTQTPEAGLHVHGNNTTAIFGDTGNNSTSALRLYGSHPGTKSAYIQVGGYKELRLTKWGSVTGEMQKFGVYSTLSHFSGKLGIGTETVPNGYDLAVQGKIIAEEIKVQLQNLWPDYVAAPSYSLMNPLTKANYFKTNKHLYGFPSATELDGKIDLGEITRLQHVQIEELVLNNGEQQAELNELKSLLASALERIEALENAQK